VPDPKKPRAAAAAAPPPPRAADAGATLEELNDQLGRFLQHADQLVEEWARFGADVRRTVDGEVGHIDQAVIDAVDRAARDVNAQVDRVAAERVERAIEQGMHKLRAEIERGGGARVAAGGGGTSAAAASAASAATVDRLRLVLGAVVFANFLLVVLVVMVWRRDPAPAPAAAAGSEPASAAVSPAVLDACAALAGGKYTAEDAERVVGAGASACGDDEGAVLEALRERLSAPVPAIVDAGAVDAAPPIDAKAKKSSK
jgi:hypothetical protein